MNVAHLFPALHREIKARTYFIRLDILDQSRAMLKVRLYISPDLYVQVYRNDRHDTTNLVLIHGGRRIYGRDQLAGQWHRHTAASPQAHDISPEGSRPTQLSEFLDEIESILIEKDLP